MTHLIRMKNNIIDFEKETKPLRTCTSDNYKGRSGEPVRLGYHIGGYWFYLTLKDWAFMRNLSVSTIRNRYATRIEKPKTIAQILGFEQMKRGRKIPTRFEE